MMNEREHSAGVILIRQGSQKERYYLLLQHANGGHWYFPKGRLEPGESPKEAALRELREETGLTDMKLVDGFLDRIEYGLPPMPGRAARKEVVFYLGRTEQETIQLSHEHDTYAWLSYPEARARLTYEDTRQLLDRAEEFLNQRER